MYNVPRSRFDLSNLQFNLLISALGGLLFFSGWWIVADIDLRNELEKHKTYYIPAVMGTMAFCFINAFPTHCFYDSFTYQRGCFSPGMARTYLFFWLMISFGCLIWAFFILVNDFILKPERYQWPGYGVCLQNTCIFVSSMLLRFAKKHDNFY